MSSVSSSRKVSAGSSRMPPVYELFPSKTTRTIPCGTTTTITASPNTPFPTFPLPSATSSPARSPARSPAPSYSRSPLPTNSPMTRPSTSPAPLARSNTIGARPVMSQPRKMASTAHMPTPSTPTLPMSRSKPVVAPAPAPAPSPSGPSQIFTFRRARSHHKKSASAVTAASLPPARPQRVRPPRTPLPTIRVLVGPNQQEFVVNRAALTRSSPFFSNYLASDTAALALPTETPAMFELFALWLHTPFALPGRIAADLAAAEPQPGQPVESAVLASEFHWTMVRLHIYAAVLELDELQDMTMDAIQDLYLRREWDVTPRFVRFLYGQCDSVASMRLRRWAVAMAAFFLACQSSPLPLPSGSGTGASKLTKSDLERDVADYRKCLSEFPEFAADYNGHLRSMSSSGLDLALKNPQLRIPSNALRNDQRRFAFRQCAFHTHRSTAGDGRCLHGGDEDVEARQNVIRAKSRRARHIKRQAEHGVEINFSNPRSRSVSRGRGNAPAIRVDTNVMAEHIRRASDNSSLMSDDRGRSPSISHTLVGIPETPLGDDGQSPHTLPEIPPLPYMMKSPMSPTVDSARVQLLVPKKRDTMKSYTSSIYSTATVATRVGPPHTRADSVPVVPSLPTQLDIHLGADSFPLPPSRNQSRTPTSIRTHSRNPSGSIVSSELTESPTLGPTIMSLAPPPMKLHSTPTGHKRTGSSSKVGLARSPSQRMIDGPSIPPSTRPTPSYSPSNRPPPPAFTWGLPQTDDFATPKKTQLRHSRSFSSGIRPHIPAAQAYTSHSPSPSQDIAPSHKLRHSRSFSSNVRPNIPAAQTYQEPLPTHKLRHSRSFSSNVRPSFPAAPMPHHARAPSQPTLQRSLTTHHVQQTPPHPIHLHHSRSVSNTRPRGPAAVPPFPRHSPTSSQEPSPIYQLDNNSGFSFLSPRDTYSTVSSVPAEVGPVDELLSEVTLALQDASFGNGEVEELGMGRRGSVPSWIATAF